jgi:methylmalonyl-CoA/ethylmalonyl-CoA epimerase
LTQDDDVRELVDRGAVAGGGAIFDHVAHAAPRIRDLLPLYRDALGGVLFHGSEHAQLGYRVALLRYADGTKLELLEPLPGSPFLDRFLERNPNGGLHHVTFRVPDLPAAVAAARRAGFEVFGVSDERPEWREAFIHPRLAHGTLVQLAEVAPGFPDRMPEAVVEAMLADDRHRETAEHR